MPSSTKVNFGFTTVFIVLHEEFYYSKTGTFRLNKFRVFWTYILSHPRARICHSFGTYQSIHCSIIALLHSFERHEVLISNWFIYYLMSKLFLFFPQTVCLRSELINHSDRDLCRTISDVYIPSSFLTLFLSQHFSSFNVFFYVSWCSRKVFLSFISAVL